MRACVLHQLAQQGAGHGLPIPVHHRRMKIVNVPKKNCVLLIQGIHTDGKPTAPIQERHSSPPAGNSRQ
jgi:hypothetical protein